MGFNKKHLYRILAIAFIFSWGYTAFTVSYIQSVNPSNVSKSSQSLNFQTMIHSADDYWYVNQYENWREGRGFTIDPQYDDLKVRRTPVYPIIYGFFAYEFGKELGLTFLKYLQILLFCISALLIYLIVINVSANSSLAFFTGVVYAVCPFIISYLPFTITEAVSPFFVTLSIYSYLKARTKQSWSWFFWTGIICSMAALNRPLILVIILSLIGVESYFMLKQRTYINSLKFGLWFFIGALFIFSPWIIRNYKVTNGEFIPLEKVNRISAMDYGYALIDIRNAVACFGNPADYNCELFVQNATENIVNNTPEKNKKLTEDFINSFPVFVWEVWNKQDFLQKVQYYFSCYQTLYDSLGNLDKEQITMNAQFLSCNEAVSNEFIKMKNEFKTKAPLRFYLITPLSHLKAIIFQSNSSNIAWLQSHGNGYTTIQKVVKGIFYLFNVIFYLTFLVSFFIPVLPGWYRLLSGLSALLLFVILTYEYRYFETRYYLIVWPFIIVNASAALHYIRVRFNIKA